MKIESLKIKNFRVFKNVEMRDIPRYCVIVGAHGTGKSTLFQVFGFLKDAMADNVQVALTKLGGIRGFSEVVSRNTNGPIEIELQFREGEKSPKITYSLQIAERDGEVIVQREILKYRRGQRGKPWHYLDFSNGEGFAVTNELEISADESALERKYNKLKSSNILAIKGLSQFKEFPAVKTLGDLIENWYVSDFHISRARQDSEAGYAAHLTREGDNIAQVADSYYQHHREIFNKILKIFPDRVPGITKVEPRITEEGRISLYFHDRSFAEPFLSRRVSDGTIKMFAYLLMLYDPHPHPLLCVEEPENQLYPTLLAALSEEFRDYASRGGQVFVSTHSPDFLNAVNLEEVFWLIKRDGYTEIKRASNDAQVRAYMEDGDSMGYLWQQKFFEGVDPQ
jgi:predicted ATPase